MASDTIMSLAVGAHDVAPLGDSIMVALFTIAVVFGALFLIFICIKIFSAVLNFGSSKQTVAPAAASAAPVAATKAPVAPAVPEVEFSSGSLKLKGCDEKTAAMIMAIVSDNTGIPLSELIFKSITLVEKK
ncbi:MAG: OadG family protein [Clostridiales bacterium]|nr:OadG family protein [Clostridiales bacterium]